jgi:hypothetical protein
MKEVVPESEVWQNSNIQIFWGEIAHRDHLMQIYENDKIFMDTLEGFVGSGFLAGESVVIIATAEHLAMLTKRLTNQNFNIEALIQSDQYIPLEATETLSKFMVGGWPDEYLFSNFISAILKRAQKNNRPIRAFGEMVAILWEHGLSSATVQMENLWNDLHQDSSFLLYCAYPKTGFGHHAHDSLDRICKCHSKVIDGQARPATEIYYRPS